MPKEPARDKTNGGRQALCRTITVGGGGIYTLPITKPFAYSS